MTERKMAYNRGGKKKSSFLLNPPQRQAQTIPFKLLQTFKS